MNKISEDEAAFRKRILAQLNRAMSESVGPAPTPAPAPAPRPARTPARVPAHILARSRTPAAPPAPAPDLAPAHLSMANFTHMISVRDTVLDLATQYDAAIFFDNEQAHVTSVTEMCPTITAIKVPETHPKPKPLFNQSPLKEYLASLGENTYINVLKQKGEIYDAYDQACGLASMHVDRVRAWIEETADKTHRVALFDWDRTFTKVEGIFAFESEAEIRTVIRGLSWSTFVRDATRYLCGGDERVQLLKDMFVTLHTNHVDIAILTNNGGCPDRVALMRAILVELLPPGVNATIYCSAPRPYAGNKGKRLQDAAKFKRICPPQAGGRRTRRAMRRRKSTRRHRKH